METVLNNDLQHYITPNTTKVLIKGQLTPNEAFFFTFERNAT